MMKELGTGAEGAGEMIGMNTSRVPALRRKRREGGRVEEGGAKGVSSGSQRSKGGQEQGEGK